MDADQGASSPAADQEEAAADQRRFREVLDRIPTVSHAVYGSCLAPEYPSQLLIALGHLASLPIGAWRGQASIDWTLDPSLVRRYRQHPASGTKPVTEPGVRVMERALIERARATISAANWASLSCWLVFSTMAPRPGCWTAAATRSSRCGSPAAGRPPGMAC